MSAQMSAQAALGLGFETIPGTPALPSYWIPLLAPSTEDIITPIKDNTMRANDSDLEGQYAGPAHSTAKFDTWGYPNETGALIRAMGLVDTVSAAGATTLNASTAIGAALIATAAAIPANTVVLIDTGLLAEARYVISGAGALNVPLAKAHASGVPVTYLTKHSFKQGVYPQGQAPSVTLTDLEVVRTRAYPGCKQSQLDIDIDGAGGVKLSSNWTGFPGQPASTPTVIEPTVQPFIGWQWQASLGAQGAGNVNRYLSAKYSFKRDVSVINGSDMTQGPKEVFAAEIDVSVAIKAEFENTADADTFNNYVQSNPLISVLASPFSGAGLVIQLGVVGFETFKGDRGSKYVQADITANGIFNAADGGSASLALFAPQVAQYI